MASRRAATALLVAAPALVACTREVVVDVTKTDDAIAIVVSRGGDAEPPCIQGLVVTQAGTDIATTSPLWEVSTAEAGRCVSSVRYGVVPTGYAQSGPAPTLLVGSRYMVEVSGPGLQGAREFTMRAGNGSLADPVGG